MSEDKPEPEVPAVPEVPRGDASSEAPPALDDGEAAPVEDFDEEGTLPGIDAPMSQIAMEGAFRAARPRIVIAHDTLGGIVELDSLSFKIGRSKRRAPNYILGHEGVSGMHAEITFTGRRFFLEDLGSTNGTFIGEEMLAPGARREIRADTRIRFGPVDTLFVCDVEPQGTPVSQEDYHAALELLVRQNRITALQRSKAEEDAAGKAAHPGEMLLSCGALYSSDWVEALEQAKILGLVGSRETRSTSPALLLIGAAVVVALVVALIKVFGD